MRVAKGVASAVQFAMYNSDNDAGIRQVAFTASKLSSSEASVDIQHSCECPTGSVSCADNCPSDNHQKIFVSVAMQYTYTPMIPYPFITQQSLAAALRYRCLDECSLPTRSERCGCYRIRISRASPLYLLILGVVDLGRYFWIGSEVDHAIEAVLRDAAVKKNMSESDITSLLKARLSTVSKQNFSVSTSYTNSTPDTPRLLTINISSSFKPLGLLSSLTFPIAGTGQVPIIDLP